MKHIVYLGVLLSLLGFCALSVPPICNDPTTHIISINTSTWFPTDLEDNGVFCIINAGNEAHIILNGRGSNPPQNWTVIIALPSLSTPAYIYVYGAKGANGTVSTYVPADDFYNVTIYSPTGPVGSGFLSAGKLLVEVSDADHLTMNIEGEVDAEINGNPAGSDLIMSAAVPSLVNVKRMNNSFLFHNFIAIIPASIAANLNQSIIITGNSSKTIIDYSNFTSMLPFLDGCLQVSAEVKPTPSAWFVQQFPTYGIPPQAAYCQLFTYQAGVLNISASSLNITGLGFQTLQHLILTTNNASLSIGNQTPYDWFEISPSSFVAEEFDITWPASSSTLIYVDSGVISPATEIQIECGSNSWYKSAWTVGQNGTTNFEWQGQCTGSMFTDGYVPFITFTGDGQISATLSVETNTTDLLGEITLQEDNFELLHDSNLFSSVRSNKTKATVKVILPQGNYSMLLDLDKKDLLSSEWKFHPESSATIYSTGDVSIGVLPEVLHFHYDQRTVTTSNGAEDNNCFQPLWQCTDDFYAQTGALGDIPCYTYTQENNCKEKQVVTIHAHKIWCSTQTSDTNFTLVVNQGGESSSSHFEQWTKYFFYCWEPICNLAFSITYYFTGGVLSLSWASFAILIALGRLTGDLSSSTIRSFIDSGANAANIFTGWSCGVDSASTWLAPGKIFCVLTLLFTCCVMVIEIAALKRNQKTTKLPRLFTCLVFWAGPYVIGKAAAPFSIIAAIFMGLGLMIFFVKKSTHIVWCTANGHQPGGDCRFNVIPSLALVMTAIACALVGHPDIAAGRDVAFAISLIVLVINIAAGIAFTWMENQSHNNRLLALILTPYCLSFACGVCFITTIYAKSNSPAGIISLWFVFNILAIIAETLLLLREHLAGIHRLNPRPYHAIGTIGTPTNLPSQNTSATLVAPNSPPTETTPIFATVEQPFRQEGEHHELDNLSNDNNKST